MDKINMSINEIIEIINLIEPIHKSKGELIQTICALDSNYYKKIEELLYLNVYTLKQIIYTILETKYPTGTPNTYKDIVFTEEMIYY
jgi:hypothetical protein